MPADFDGSIGQRDLVRREGSRILIAEDDPELRSLLSMVLTEDGHLVDEVADGRQFVDVLACLYDDGIPVDIYGLIISDIRMPGFSGLDVLSALRCLRSHVPVIIITAFGDETTRRLALGLGALAVLEKPFDLDELRAAVVNVLARPRPSSGLPRSIGWA
jgi:two-component system, response regulator, stage 0 sporulation protein F